MKKINFKKKLQFKKMILPIVLIAVYFLTRLIALTLLPVFADESIYIRWSQLIIDDWRQYLFFPMNDGKTPLFIWLTTISLKLFSDPLFAGRIISVLAGLMQMIFTVKSVKALKGNKVSQFFAAASIIFLPYWYFHHRMALMDGLMTALLSGSFYYLLKATQQKKKIRFPISKNLILSGLFFGLAIWTKIPSVLFIPTLILVGLFTEKKTFKKLPQNLTSSFITILLGITIFVVLKLHPAFGQLFNRGNDFLYTLDGLREIGLWKILVFNTTTTITTYLAYLTLPVILLPLIGMFQDKHRRRHAVLILATLSFLAPILLLGKTVYPRYILPSAFALTLSASLAFGEFFENTQKLLTKNLLNSLLRMAVLVIIITTIANQVVAFTLISWKNTDYIPFTLADRVQYLEEWSSGHGIKEVTGQILISAKAGGVAAATEGYFGTLPDGILMYLHQEDVYGVLVQGIGQPVRKLSDDFVEKAVLYDQNWLIVNSHRELMGLDKSRPELLLQEYCRPNNAPCLQVWDVKAFAKEEN